MSDFFDMFVNTPYVPPARKKAEPKAATKKRRGRPEDMLQKSIVGYLRRSLPNEAWFCAVPNGAVLRGNDRQRMLQMEKLKATGLRPGAPDLFVFWAGRAFGLEVKAGSKQADTQKQVEQQLNAAGVPYNIVQSIDDVERFLRSHGLPLRASVVTS